MNARRLLSLCAASLMMGSAMALNHGSISARASQMYAQIDDNSGANTSAPVAGMTLDYKLVTIGSKTWVWTSLHGKSLNSEAWSSQLRWWTPGKVATTLSGRVAGTQQTYETITQLPAINPVPFSIFQYDSGGGWVYRETAKVNYNYTLLNSKDDADTTAPVLANPVVSNQSSVSLELTLSATDNSGDFFYYIADAANNYAEVSFFSNVSITLDPGKDYNFSIQAIDFSGNESAAKTVTVTGDTFDCYNLLDNKTFTIEKVYFAPNWAENNNYTASVTDNVVTANFQNATSGQWQAQLWLSLNTPLTLTPGEKYSLLVDVEPSQDAWVYMKVAGDKDDSSVFMEIPVQKVYKGGATTVAAYDLVCPASLTQVTKVIFDFGNNPAVNLTISNISLCGTPPPATVVSRGVKTADSFGTICFPGAVTATNALLYEVAGATYKGETPSVLYLNEVAQAAAGTPYIYKAIADGEVSFEFRGDAQATAGEANGLVGAFTSTLIPNEQNYILNANDNQWYLVDEDDVSCGANFAYLDLSKVTRLESAPSNSRAIYFDDKGATSIRAGQAAAMVDVYTLEGIKVRQQVEATKALDGLAKGIYMVNGRKVVVTAE